MSYIEKEKLIKADIASIENRVRHAFNQGYDLGFKDGKKRAKPLEQEQQTFKWCTDCKEYDQEKHCCHRWSKVIRNTVEEMKQEQEPRKGHCKDCKWWKDNDGTYRRGVKAESQCPINRKEVYEGNGYCFLYEPQESEGE